MPSAFSSLPRARPTPYENHPKAERNLAALEEYVSLQQQAFDQYLEDQYAVAKGALLRTLPGGEIALVMCEGAPDIMTALEQALAK